MPNLRATALATASAGLLVVALSQTAAGQGRGGSTGSSFSTASPRSSFTGPSNSPTTGGALGGSLATPRSNSTITPSGALPPSAIGTPAPQVPPIAPLSPPTTSTFLAGAGTTVTTPGVTTTTTTTPGGRTTTTPGVGVSPACPGSGGGASTSTSTVTSTSASPSQSAPSIPGGGADTFEGCMGFWDAGTHMSKREWAASCRRMMNRLQNLQSELT